MNNKINFDIIYVNKKIKKISKLLNSNNFNYNDKKNLHLICEYKKLFKIKDCFDNFIKYSKELEDVKLLINNDELNILIKDEIYKLNNLINYYSNKLKKYFFYLKRDKKDILNAYLEIHSGTGGNEASLFALDLFKMYIKYIELMKWKVKLINVQGNLLNGYKEILFKIVGNNVYGNLKFESGGHRVQRIPKTESQGRIHTSTCIVAVIPDIPLKNLPIINSEDIKIDTFRSSGAGGQHVNTTNSAVRITHLSTGIVVECQQERSQHKNKSRALEVLKARIHNLELSKRHKKEYSNKKKLLGSGLRWDRSRTYNFIQNRVTDHRINLTLYCLNDILNGNLNLLIKPLIKNYYKK